MRPKQHRPAGVGDVQSVLKRARRYGWRLMYPEHSEYPIVWYRHEDQPGTKRLLEMRISEVSAHSAHAVVKTIAEVAGYGKVIGHAVWYSSEDTDPVLQIVRATPETVADALTIPNILGVQKFVLAFGDNPRGLSEPVTLPTLQQDAERITLAIRSQYDQTLQLLSDAFATAQTFIRLVTTAEATNRPKPLPTSQGKPLYLPRTAAIHNNKYQNTPTP